MDLPISTLDIIAMIWFAALVVGYRLVALLPALQRRNIQCAVQRQRIKWMQTMVRRDNRVVDTFVLGNLGQGNAFFASTSAIAIGGLATVLGKGESARDFLQSLPYVAPMPPLLWELKVVFLIGIFIYAFFKFAWAFRMSHYTGIMIGATPLLDATSVRACEEHAYRCAVLSGISAEHSSAGLRAIYYSIAALAWFFHPLLFMLATAWVMGILARRDYLSRARMVLAEEDDLTGIDLPSLRQKPALKSTGSGGL
jgi:uncharacterized membrane protein